MEVRIVAKQESDRVAHERESTAVENRELRRQVDEWESQQRSVDREQHQIREQFGEVVRELFRIPEVTLNKIVQPRSKNEAGGLSPAEIAELKARFQQLATSNGDQVVDHLLTFQEMRKQFDVWEFYLNEDVVLQLRNRFPPTKNSVLILCSYGDCQLSHRLSLTRGLPAISSRLRQDGQGTQNFEYALFGYRPQPQFRPAAAGKK